MIDVGQNLVVGVRVNGRHDAVLDANLFVQRLDQWCEAVGRARCIGNDRVIGSQRVMVDAVNDRAVNVLAARGRQDDFLRAAVDVLAGGVAGAEQGRCIRIRHRRPGHPREAWRDRARQTP